MAGLRKLATKAHERLLAGAAERGQRADSRARGVAVNKSALEPYRSYGDPDFVMRGYYLDQPFRCMDCGRDEVWTATQQKWWYEVAKGHVFSGANRCRPCRRRERERRDEARRVSLAGLARRKPQPVESK